MMTSGQDIMVRSIDSIVFLITKKQGFNAVVTIKKTVRSNTHKPVRPPGTNAAK